MPEKRKEIVRHETSAHLRFPKVVRNEFVKWEVVFEFFGFRFSCSKLVKSIRKEGSAVRHGRCVAWTKSAVGCHASIGHENRQRMVEVLHLGCSCSLLSHHDVESKSSVKLLDTNWERPICTTVGAYAGSSPTRRDSTKCC